LPGIETGLQMAKADVEAAQDIIRRRARDEDGVTISDELRARAVLLRSKMMQGDARACDSAAVEIERLQGLVASAAAPASSPSPSPLSSPPPASAVSSVSDVEVRVIHVARAFSAETLSRVPRVDRWQR
jgi:hypothetical protein